MASTVDLRQLVATRGFFRTNNGSPGFGAWGALSVKHMRHQDTWLMTLAAPIEISVTCLGKPASNRLETTGIWQVGAVFERSFYLFGPEESLVCVGDESIGKGPLNLLCRLDGPKPIKALGLLSGCAAQCEPGRISLDQGQILDYTGAEVWSPDSLIPDQHCPALVSGVEAFARVARRRETSEQGIWPLAESVLGLASPPPMPNPLFELAKPAMEASRDWLGGEKETPGALNISEAVDGLLGLGPGLTPAGDDFLGGVMMGLWAMGKTTLLDSLARLILDRARRATGRISLAFLECASRGQGPETLHNLIEGVKSQDWDLEQLTRDLEQIGHSSGWDMAAGVLLAMAVVSR